MAKGKGFFIVLIGMSLAVAILFTQLPTQGFDTDLDAIGQGQPAVVLGFINHSPRGIEAMGKLGDVRDGYEDQVVFRVADILSRDGEGEAFSERYNAGDGVIALFDGEGNHLGSHRVPDTEAQLRELLDPLLE
ncbi:MAG: hypothetical protein EA349_14600 [Halomonadaceae bacterium]|nr:MAG: hypothetical protein EA349_14600 [Halomonadaceae bacterium]